MKFQKPSVYTLDTDLGRRACKKDERKRSAVSISQLTKLKRKFKVKREGDGERENKTSFCFQLRQLFPHLLNYYMDPLRQLLKIWSPRFFFALGDSELVWQGNPGNFLQFPEGILTMLHVWETQRWVQEGFFPFLLFPEKAF